jgi:hypothetical protein|tara:strand:+ start:2815 stop:3303 length:489 start_codon:yes stop_codon:yes gene_type:complete
MQLSKAMNKFQDEQGRVWLCTPNMAKHLGVSDGGLAAYKHNGTLKRGVHWVQQTTGHRRVFYNKDVVMQWWRGEIADKLNMKQNTEKGSQDTVDAKHRNVSVYLTKELHEQLLAIQENSSVTVERKIDGILLHTQEEQPKLGTIVNMLLSRAIKEYHAEIAK